jgi:prepilin-type processing-associated H-X9-DG protein
MPQFPFKWPPVTQIVAAVCIVGFVAAIIFPVFQHVHEGGGPSCQSNLKQLNLALVQYEQDYDYVYPSGVNISGNGWGGQLYAYVKSRRAYRCPKDYHDGTFISYAENQTLVRIGYKTLTNPAATVALYEFTTLNCDPSTPEAVSATGINAPQDSTRHDPKTFGLNFLMTDGHVKMLLPAQVSGGSGAVSPQALPERQIVRTFAVK